MRQRLWPVALLRVLVAALDLGALLGRRRAAAVSVAVDGD